jgi:hypothetical protein
MNSDVPNCCIGRLVQNVFEEAIGRQEKVNSKSTSRGSLHDETLSVRQVSVCRLSLRLHNAATVLSQSLTITPESRSPRGLAARNHAGDRSLNPDEAAQSRAPHARSCPGAGARRPVVKSWSQQSKLPAACWRCSWRSY